MRHPSSARDIGQQRQRGPRWLKSNCAENKVAWLTALVATTSLSIAGCAASRASGPGSSGGPGGSSSSGGSSGGSGGIVGQAGFDGGGSDACTPHCAANRQGVAGCDEMIIQPCAADEMCQDAKCMPACQAATQLRSSVGCDYYPVQMEAWAAAEHGCFAVFVANSWQATVHPQFEYRGVKLNPATFGSIPSGSGINLTYEHYDPSKGIEPGEVGIFFLAGPADPNNDPAVGCPDGFPPAVTDGTAQLDGTGKGFAFHMTTDVPVVAYQMLPYGAGSSGLAGASLLMPTSVWDTNYVAINAYDTGGISNTRPSLNIIAMEDNTQVKILPRVDVLPGAGVKRTDANTLMTINLNRGEQLQISQRDQLTGSPIEATKPIGLMAGHECMFVPTKKDYCDHAEQQIPPIKAMGNEYAVAPFRPRSSAPEHYVYRLFGAVDGTTVTFDPPAAHGTVSLSYGQIVEFETMEAFVAKSQDSSHPFLLAAYMTGSSTVQEGYGDPDFVRIVPPQQFLQRYVFFSDPTYPETNLVIVRKKGADGFADVNLDCAGALKGWLPLGTSGQYEFVWFDLVRHDFQPNGSCDNGRHEMTSDEPFGLWVWGWGTSESNAFSKNVSYGYPAGESVVQLNNVHVTPQPK